MTAAALLRLREAARRGVPLALAAAMAVAALVAFAPGARLAARFALATDLAAALGYLFALFQGALPVPTDRERGRHLLAAVSPIPPALWALGNALGSAAAAAIFSAGLFLAAGAGAGLAGGVETRRVRPFPDSGTLWLPLRVQVEPGDRAIRFPVAAVPDGSLVDSPARYAIRVRGGGTFSAPVGMPIEIPAPARDFVLENGTEGLSVGILSAQVRALGDSRPFLPNALLSGAGPALGAAALAALATAAGAHLSGGVAALLAGAFLLLASLRGFLLDAIEHGGRAAAEMRGALGAAVEEHSQRILGLLLRAVPDLQRLDSTAEVAAGEWTGGAGAGEGAILLLAALAIAALAGGLGASRRRLP